MLAPCHESVSYGLALGMMHAKINSTFMRYWANPTCCFFPATICGSAGQQLPLLYYKEGERLTELSNYLRDGNDQMVEVRMPFTARFLHKSCAI